MRKPLTLAIVLIIAVINSSCGQSDLKVNDKADLIDELVSQYSKYEKFNGAVLVADQGEVIYKNGFGLANMEWDLPIDTDTKFRIASLTKQFTATLIVQLVAEGKLDLHIPISNYLPGYPRENGNRITVHHLLTHSSGTPEFDVFMNYKDIERKRLKPEELVDIYASQPLEFAPGQRFQYTNTGYVTLGVIIEEITGKSYQEVLHEKILDPLEMHNSGYDDSYTLVQNRASGYSQGYLRGHYVNTNDIDMSIPYAAGSMYSTVEDLYLWDRALYSTTFLDQKHLDLLATGYIPARDREYGYGFFIGELQVGNSEEEVKSISHGGGINGFNTLITRMPSSKSLVVLLNNTERAPLNEMTVAINGILNDQPYKNEKSVAYSLIEHIQEHGLSSGINYYEEIKNSEDFYLSLHEMNKIGYELVNAERLEDAREVFSLNVEAYPKSFIVYDSYGDVLRRLGDATGAIENYKKSVALNPDNRGGLRALEELAGAS